MSSNSFAVAKLATAKLKMKMLPAGFPVALCNTAIQFCDPHNNRSFLLLRIADFVVEAVDVVDVSVSEFVACPPGEPILHFQALFYGIDKFLSLSKSFLVPIIIQTKNSMFGVL